jgi:hypothetical protein
MEASMIHNRLSTWRHAVARRRLLLALLAGACFLALPVSTAAAGNASHDVENFTVSPDTMCGFTGTSHWVIHFTSVPTGKGSTINAGKIVQTFVADNGRGLKISFDAGVFIAGPTVYNPDGSSSFTAVEDGLSAKTQALNGPLLEQSTGRVFITYYFDANGEFVSLTIDSTTGPQNNTTGEPDCSVIGPYLAGA